MEAKDAISLGEAFLERYEVVEWLGAGGFGTVYKARQRTTGQSVAVKVLRAPGDQSEDEIEKRIARFHREMRLCARLHHPNIVRLLDSGRGEDGGVYTVFEFIPGRNLSAILAEEKRLPPAQACHLMMQVLDALACAHAQGVVHRDLKPANIMVVSTGARRNAVVLDFGIGVLIEGERGSEDLITKSQEWIGTPIYTAPELIRGSRPLPRSDIYSWGLVFLECLTGERVIRGETVADMLFQQLSAEPILMPSMLAMHPLGRVLQRATRKDPDTRDVTADGLLRELEECPVSDLGQLPGLDGGASRLSGAGTRQAGALVSETGRVESERRQITVVSCTLSAVSSGSGEADLEELAPHLGVEAEECATIASRAGGHVAGVLGDTALFFFGYPIAREDDARRAARVALAMLAELRARNEAKAKRRGLLMDVRVGIHTGMILTRDLASAGGLTRRTVGGPTQQMAMRLSALAQPGEILVSSECHRLLRGHAACDRLFALLDAGAPVDVYRLREGTVDPDLRDVLLVGRRRELGALLEGFQRVRGGAGQAALITGEPGIGKSRLVRALREELRAEDHTYVEVRCAPDAKSSPLSPIIEMLDRLIDPGRDLPAVAKAERLSALLSDHGLEPGEAMPLFTSLMSVTLPARFPRMDVSPQKQREMTRHALLSLLFGMAERAPLVLVIEDLQWADPSTLELCAALVHEVASGPVYALFVSRPDLTPPWSPAAALAMTLGRLEPPDVERMASAVSGGRALPPEVVAWIVARTEGVPLFIEEFVRAMLDTGVLVERDGRMVPSRPLDELGIPTTLRDLLTARFDRLGRAKATAQVAAAIGREFSFELLRAVLGADLNALREDMDELVAAGLVHRKRRLRNPAYSFKHALVQDTAYGSMPKSRQREIHEHAARTLQRDFGEATEGQPEVLAWHLERAGLDLEAADELLLAGQHALQRSAFVEATTLLSRGAELVARAPSEEGTLRRELRLRSTLGGALVASRGFGSPEYEANCARARALCDQLGDPPELFAVVFALWQLHVVRGDQPEAVERHARELSEIAERQSNPDMLISACQARGATCYFGQRYEEAREWLLRTVSLWDPRQHARLVQAFGDDHGLFAHNYLQHVELFLGDVAGAVRYAERARALAEELRYPLGSGAAAVHALHVWHMLGDADRLEAEATRSLELTRKHGLLHWEMLTRVAHGLALVRRGDAGAGLERIREGMAFLALNGQWSGRPYCALYLAEALHLAGRGEEALQAIEETLAGVAGKLDQGGVADLLRAKARVLAAAGDEGGAAELYRHALAKATEQGNHWAVLVASLDVARGLLAEGEREAARACLAAALAKVRGGEGFPAYDQCVALLRDLDDAGAA